MPFSTADPNAYVSLALQSALGTPNTTPAKYRFAKYAAGNNVNDIIAAVDIREGGDGLDFGQTYQARTTVEGQLSFNIRPEIAGQVFQLLPGAATWTGGSAPALHRFHSNHASHPWATLQVAYPGTSLVRLIRDVRFLSLGLQFRTGQPLMVNANFRGIAAGASTGIALVPSYPAGDPFFVYHSLPTILIGGVEDDTVEEIRIDMQLGSEDLQAQSPTLDDIVILNRDTNVTLTRRFENTTLYKQIYYGGAVQPTSAIATTAISAYWALGSLNLKVDLPLVSLRGNSLPDLDPDGRTVRETITGKSLSNPSGALSISLSNLHASAYG